MAKTLSDCRSRTRMFLDEASPKDWSNDQLDVEINNGYQEVVTEVKEVDEDFYTISTNFDTIENQQEYTTTDGVPTDIDQIRRVEINYNPDNSSGVAVRATPAKTDEVLRDLGNLSNTINLVSSPVYFVYGSGSGSTGIKIGFIPYPTKDGTDAVKLWYVPIVADLSESTDELNIPNVDRYWMSVCKYAAAELLRKGQQEEASAARYMLEFRDEMERMKQQLESRINDGTQHIIDSLGENTDFTFWA